MDGWMDFIPPGGTEPKGLGTLSTYNSSASPMVSHKPFELHFAQLSFLLPLASCLDCWQIVLEVTFSKCSASHSSAAKAGSAA